VIAQAPGQAWGRWPEQLQPHHTVDTYYPMDISGLVQSYDSRVASSAPLTRTIMAPQYFPQQTYSAATSNNLMAPQQHVQHNPFSYNPYNGGNINVLVPAPAFANYMQQRPPPRLVQTEPNEQRGLPYARTNTQGFVEEIHNQHTPSPTIKAEPQWNPPSNPSPFVAGNRSSKTITSTAPTNGSSEATFATEVDTLMRAIQAKSQSKEPQQSSSIDKSRPVVGASHIPPYVQSPSSGGAQALGQNSKSKLTHEDLQDDSRRSKDKKKQFICTIGNCFKTFQQKTHLDIHERSHTGDKPYVSIPNFVKLIIY